MTREKVIGLIIPIIIGFFNVLIILFPADMIAAAREGLGLWFNNVLPSLLPFLIFTNILTASGAIHSIGALLEPIMLPFFGVSGEGGFAFAAGMVSGYPVGAKIVAQLRSEGRVSRTEAQRLMAFCNNAGPLFMLGAVGVSMLHSAKLGYFIMAVHYISAVITGLLFKYYGRERPGDAQPLSGRRPASGKRPAYSFGRILGDSVKNAMETMALVGGFIILFCVLVKILEVTRVIELTSARIGIDPLLYQGVVVGLMEVTNGAKILSAESLSQTQLMAVCGVVAFGGFCVHAQAISFISHTDIQASVYLLAKAIQALIAVAACSLLYPVVALTNDTAPVFLSNAGVWEKLVFPSASFAVLLTAAVVFSAWRRLWR